MSSQALKKYYYSFYTDFFIDVIKNREIIFLNNIGVIYRGMLIKKKRDFFFWARLYDFFRSDFNLYMSKAVYKIEKQKLPISYTERKLKLKKFIYEDVDYVDVLLDFDAKNKKTLEEITSVKKYLTQNYIKHYLISSGNNYHIVISGKQIFEELRNKNVPGKDKFKISETITKALMKKFNLKTIDKCSPYLKIMKVPYSLVHSNNNIKVCVLFPSSVHLKTFKNDDNIIKDTTSLLKLIQKQIYEYNKGDVFVFRNYDDAPRKKTLYELLKTY